MNEFAESMIIHHFWTNKSPKNVYRETLNGAISASAEFGMVHNLNSLSIFNLFSPILKGIHHLFQSKPIAGPLVIPNQ